MRHLLTIVLSAFLVLTGCAHLRDDHSTVMDQPITFDSSSEFYRALQALEKEISPEEYQRLTDAIGYLQAHDLEHLDYEEFHQNLAGLSPNQIIEQASVESEGD